MFKAEMKIRKCGGFTPLIHCGHGDHRVKDVFVPKFWNLKTKKNDGALK